MEGKRNSLLTVAEAAAILNLAQGTIRSWLLSRRIASVRLGRAVRIPKDEVARIIAEGTIPARVG